MGSWSVYCGISQIAITSGDKCALLPLKENHLEGYLPFLPATLPIFGTYDDYGGLENIEENANTKFIEEYFGISILDFTKIFTDWLIFERDEAKEITERCLHFDEVKKMKFMFIDRKVYDYMSQYTEKHSRGQLDFGHESILTYLGFTYLGEDDKNPTDDPKRFKKVWEYEGRKFYSDGWVLSVIGGRKHSDYIMYFNDKNNPEYSLCNFITLPEDKMWIGQKSMHQIWKLLSPRKRMEKLGWIITGSRHHDDGMETLDEILMRTIIKSGIDPLTIKPLEPRNIGEAYTRDFDTFGDGLSELVTIRKGLHCMSGYFAPYIEYLTPQCGEHREHQGLMKKFLAINRVKMDEREYDTDEELELEDNS